MTKLYFHLSAQSKDPNFNEALALAQERQKNSQSSFTTLFEEAYSELSPDGRLSRIFSNAANRGRISFESTNAEVMEMINTEVEQSIDRAFQILRTRVACHAIQVVLYSQIEM